MLSVGGRRVAVWVRRVYVRDGERPMPGEGPHLCGPLAGGIRQTKRKAGGELAGSFGLRMPGGRPLDLVRGARRAFLTGLAATLVLSAAAPQAQADGVSVEVSGGNLQIAHDPGTYGGLTVYYYPAGSGGPSYSVRAGWIPAGGLGPPGPMSTPVRSS